MTVPLFQVDAFAHKPFAGNPAAVCLLDGPVADAWMQSVALEMNLSERPHSSSPQADGYGLRWCPPAVEVDLCGHATLASAHVLWETGRLAADAEARFHTRSGLLTARKVGEWIELNFPATPPTESPLPDGLESALGATARFVGKSRFDYLVEVESARIVREMQPDHAALRHLPVRGVMVTAADDGGYDFVSRFFAPGSGIDEDPVTGSAHCCLAPYWAAKLGKREMTAFQASRRGGVVRVRLGEDRVYLQGQAVTVLRGELAV